jgi:hypothetical protein
MRRVLSFSPVIRPGKPGLILIPVLLGLLASAACGGKIYLVRSLDLPRAIVIDGDAGDWSGALSYVDKDHLFVGFINDRDDLYICLNKESDRDAAGPARPGGWTIWFDPAGGAHEAFGLRIGPVGGPAGREPGEPDGQPPPSEGGVELQWLGPGGNVLRQLSPEEAAKLGLEVSEERSGGADILEMKIPLRQSEGHPFAVGAEPGGLVGVGFFSYKPEGRGPRRVHPGGMEGGLPGGRTGGGMVGETGGRGGGWRGGMLPNMNPDLSKAVKLWARVRLLASDAPARSKVLDLGLE